MLRRPQAQLEAAKKSFVGFGCGSENSILLVPLLEFKKWLPRFHVTERENGKPTGISELSTMVSHSRCISKVALSQRI